MDCLSRNQECAALLRSGLSVIRTWHSRRILWAERTLNLQSFPGVAQRNHRFAIDVAGDRDPQPSNPDDRIELAADTLARLASFNVALRLSSSHISGSIETDVAHTMLVLRW